MPEASGGARPPLPGEIPNNARRRPGPGPQPSPWDLERPQPPRPAGALPRLCRLFAAAAQPPLLRFPPARQPATAEQKEGL